MQNKKKVFYLRTDICNQILIAGGSVSHTIGVIQGLLDHDHEVFAASSIVIEQILSCPIKRFKPLQMPKKIEWLRWKINCFFSSFIFFRQCYDFFKEIGEVDYIYQRYSILNFTGVLLHYTKKIPFILEYNGSELWLDRYWSKKKIISFRWLIKFVEWLNIHCADKIIVVSKPLQYELINRGICSKRIVVNPNGVNTAVYDPARLVEDRNDFRQQLGITDNFVFGFIGTFGKWHGIEMLVAMIPMILKQKQQSRFLLIGDGPLLDYLKDNLSSCIEEKKVICTGIIPQHEAKKYLAACDAFLSPTQPNPDGTPFFGSPTKLFEYLSMAKPVIASELDQVAEIISPSFKIDDLKSNKVVTDQVGIIVSPTHVRDFIHAACWLVDLNCKQQTSMGFNARVKAVKEHDWKMHVERIMMG